MPLKKSHIFFYIAALLICGAFAPGDGFPVPSGISNMLFYVQRSLNKNTIIYQLNVNAREEINEAEPINIYWVNYAGKGETEPLSYIQKKYAYGIESRLTDADKKTFSFNFVSYKKQTLYLIRSPADKRYKVFCYFSNRLLIINRIYIHIEGGTFWVPKVKYIQLSAKDPATNEDVIEKIIP